MRAALAIAFSFTTLVAAQNVPIPRVLDAETTRASPVADAVKRAAEELTRAEPRAKIADALESALREAGGAASDNGGQDTTGGDAPAAARLLLRDVRKAAEIEPRLRPSPVEAELGELAAALIDSKLPPDLLGNPVPVYLDPQGQIISRWQQLTLPGEHERMDPALRLYQRGRAALPALIELLDDTATTRTVLASPQEGGPPQIMRRQDIALLLIEATAHCSFSRALRMRNNVYSGTATPLISLPDAARAELIAAVREWWSQTRGLSPPEAISWRIEHVNCDEQFEMIGVLLVQGEKERGVRHLRALLDDCPNAQARDNAAMQLLRLGDTRPLDRLRARLASEKPIDNSALNLLVQYGGRSEFELLQKLVADDVAAAANNARPQTADAIVSVLYQSANPLSIPVMIEGLRSTAVTGYRAAANGGTQPYGMADLAAEKIQGVAGVDFGYRPDDTAPARAAAIARIQEWWQNEGRGRFGLAAREARRRGGIR